VGLLPQGERHLRRDGRRRSSRDVPRQLEPVRGTRRRVLGLPQERARSLQEVRAGDGVHFTPTGYDQLARASIRAAAAVFGLHRQAVTVRI
jgi:hypothetical protein